MIRNNVLSTGMHNAISNTAKSLLYVPMDEVKDQIYVAYCPKFFSNELDEVIEEEYGKFRTLASYFRRNGPSVDTTPRIHSDRDINGEHPTHGIIYYIDIEEGGTAFYHHSKHGYSLPHGIDQPEEEYSDESLWKFREIIAGAPNRMIGYEANLFHQRYPTVSNTERLIWASFIVVEDT
jgi:hypothetical protein